MVSFKHILILPLPVAFIMAMISCSDEYNDMYIMTKDIQYLNVNSTSLSFPATASSQTVNVQSNSTPWTISNTSDWVSLSSTSGSTSADVVVNVTENTQYTTSGRACLLTLASGGNTAFTRTIAVNQESPELLLVASPTEVTMSGNASSASVTVKANSAWTYSVSDDSWLSVSKTDEGLNLTAMENTTGSRRSATISLQVGSKYENVRITQESANTVISDSTINFSFANSTKTLSISTESSWEAKTNYSWIDISPKSGTAGTHTLSISVTKNSTKETRIGSFSIGNKEITVNQEGVVLSVSPTKLTFSEEGESQQLAITSNTKWSLSTSTEWLKLDRTSGEGNANVVVTAEKNTKDLRNGVIRLQTTDELFSEMIEVGQNGYGIENINTLAPFAAEGGTINFDHLYFASWKADVASDINWIHVNPSSGNSSTSLTITVDPTSSASDRNSYVDLFYTNGPSYRLAINQYGAGLIVNTNSYQFFAKGGTSEAITVEKTGDITISSSATWLKVMNNGNIITLTADANLTGLVRDAKVTIKLIGTTISKVITVTQASQKGDFTIEDYGNDTNISPK